MPFAATWMDLEIAILSKVSQTEKDKILHDITFIWNLKKKSYKFTKQKQSHRCRKQTYDCQGGKGRSDKLGDWD